MLNEVNIQGRLVKDPELKHTQDGRAVLTFTVACDRDYVSQGGQKECDFVPCVAWNKNAEFISKYFHKGEMIVVSGRLQVRNYEDRNGNKRTATEVIVFSNYFCGSKQNSLQELDTDDYGELPFD